MRFGPLGKWSWSAFVLLLLIVLLAARASAPPRPPQAAQPARKPAPVRMEVFVLEGCPHCARAKEFLAQLKAQMPELVVVEREVSNDPEAVADLERLAAAAGEEQVGVPTFHIGDRIISGFSGEDSTGKEIREALERIRPPPPPSSPVGAQETSSPLQESSSAMQKKVSGPENTSDSPARRLQVPFLGEVDPSRYGLPAFTVLLGLIDGFNPCAMWVLLFILSFLIHLKSRKRMLIVAGTFLLISALAYFAFMAAWLSIFRLMGASRGIQLTLGILAIGAGAIHVKDYFAFHRGPSLSIPDSAKPTLARYTRRVLQAETLPGTLLAVGILALLVNAVELLCTAGLPAIYTQILSSHGLPAWKHYGYLLLYNAAYMLDDSAMLLVAVVTLSQHRLQERGGRLLKLVSGVVMVGLGLLLVFKPQWLSWG